MNSPALESVASLISGAGEIRLNLGGCGEGFLDGRIPGFITVDLREGPNTDIVADCSDLRFFKTSSVSAIYASNILEHWPHGKTVEVLKEWRRVLKNSGKAYISVPDFDVAVKLYSKEGLTDWLLFHLWGDQKHKLNFHYTCFTFATLAKALIDAGFSDVKRAKKWPFSVSDGSQNVDSHYGMMISLNIETTA